MRIILTAAAVGSLVAVAAPVLPSSAAEAQYWAGGHRSDIRRAQRECRRDLRRADSRREYYRELRDCRRDLARARYGRYRDDRYGYRGYDRGYDRGYYGYNNRGYRDRWWDGYSWRYRR